MKTIGLIGGTTWISTIDYYRYFNQLTQERLGGKNSAKCIIHSINFEKLLRLYESGDWDSIADWLISIAKQLEQSGADCLLLGCNTFHKVADKVSQSIHIPMIHIAEATAGSIVETGINKVALLGTRITMEDKFYKDILWKNNIQTIIPPEKSRELIHHAIYHELSSNILLENTKNEFLKIIERLIKMGAEGIILGCTEIPLLIKKKDVKKPLFDTTYLHAKAAVDFAMN